MEYGICTENKIKKVTQKCTNSGIKAFVGASVKYNRIQQMASISKFLVKYQKTSWNDKLSNIHYGCSG